MQERREVLVAQPPQFPRPNLPLRSMLSMLFRKRYNKPVPRPWSITTPMTMPFPVELVAVKQNVLLCELSVLNKTRRVSAAWSVMLSKEKERLDCSRLPSHTVP